MKYDDIHLHELTLDRPKYIIIWVLINHAFQTKLKNGKQSLFIEDSEAFIDDLANKLKELHAKEAD